MARVKREPIKIEADIRERLKFLADPIVYYQANQNKLSETPNSLGLRSVQTNLETVLGENPQGLKSAAIKLRKNLHAILVTAKEILGETEDSTSIHSKELDIKIATIDENLAAIRYLQTQYLQGEDKDNPAVGLFHKFFVGHNTIESCIINAAEIIRDELWNKMTYYEDRAVQKKSPGSVNAR